MEHFVDWNCHLLPHMRQGITYPMESLKAMQELYERAQITQFCMMPEYDCNLESVSQFLLRRYRAEQELKAVMPPKSKIKLKIAARVALAPGLHQTQELQKLLITSMHYLPLTLPIGDYQDWMDFELNRLLYGAKIKNLMFTSFEICLLFYPNEIIKKLLRIPNAVFQVNYRALTEKKVQKLVRFLMRQNRTLLLGTSINSMERVYQFDMDFYTKSAIETIPIADYQTMLKRSRLFWSK